MVWEEEVRQRSYEIWQREGCPEGRSLENWLRAEAQLQAEHQRKTRAKTFEYQARVFRFEESHRAVQPKPHISARPLVILAERVGRDSQPVAA